VTEWKGDILAVGVTEKDMAKDVNSKFENPILKKLDAHLGGLLADVSSEEDFSGKPGQSTVLRLPGLGSKRVGLIGLGKSASTPSAFQSLGEAVAAAAKASQASSVAVVLASSESVSNESKLCSASAIASGVLFVVVVVSSIKAREWLFHYHFGTDRYVELLFIFTGTVLGLFEDSRYKSESKKPSLKSVDIIGFGSGPELEKKLKYAEHVSYGVIFGKELVNSPANVLTPGEDCFLSISLRLFIFFFFNNVSIMSVEVYFKHFSLICFVSYSRTS